MCAHRRERKENEFNLKSLWPVGASRLVRLIYFRASRNRKTQDPRTTKAQAAATLRCHRNSRSSRTPIKTPKITIPIMRQIKRPVLPLLPMVSSLIVVALGLILFLPNAKVWHGGDWASRAKRTGDVVRRCHHCLVSHLHFGFSVAERSNQDLQ